MTKAGFIMTNAGYRITNCRFNVTNGGSHCSLGALDTLLSAVKFSDRGSES